MSHYTMLYKYGKSTREFLGPFNFYFLFSFLYFGGVFNETIMELALVGYEMITANSYPTHARGIINNYTRSPQGLRVNSP